jgi:DNA-binding transcriptional LysR family regulator
VEHRQLRIFCVLARTLSFTRAAFLEISQETICVDKARAVAG